MKIAHAHWHAATNVFVSWVILLPHGKRIQIFFVGIALNRIGLGRGQMSLPALGSF